MSAVSTVPTLPSQSNSGPSDFARPAPAPTRLGFSYTYELPLPTHRFAAPLFSWSYKLLFPQLPCFHKYLRCPIVFSLSVVSLSRHSPLFHAKSFTDVLLQTLWARQKTQPLCNQPNPIYPPWRNSFAKTPGVGDPPLLPFTSHRSPITSHVNAFRINTYRTLQRKNRLKYLWNEHLQGQTAWEAGPGSHA